MRAEVAVWPGANFVTTLLDRAIGVSFVLMAMTQSSPVMTKQRGRTVYAAISVPLERDPRIHRGTHVAAATRSRRGAPVGEHNDKARP